MKESLVLKFHNITDDTGARVLAVEAMRLPASPHDEPQTIATGGVRQMADWLARHGYAYRVGSSGIWERAA